MIAIVIGILTALFGYSLGKTSNGMTSPRQAFNFWTGPFAAVLGMVIAVIAWIFGAGAFSSLVFTGALVGFIAGLIGLGAARLSR